MWIMADGSRLLPREPCRHRSFAYSGDSASQLLVSSFADRRSVYTCSFLNQQSSYQNHAFAISSPDTIQIVLSHFSMPTGDLGPIESFPHRQLRTTTDVLCSDSVAFMHGGLHLQVTHHLFPRLPRHNLRRASELVKQFAAEQGLTYAEF